MMLRADVARSSIFVVSEMNQDMAIRATSFAKGARDFDGMLSGMGGDEVFAGYPRSCDELAGALDLAVRARRPAMRAWRAPPEAGGKLDLPLRNAKKFAPAQRSLESRYMGFGKVFSRGQACALHGEMSRRPPRHGRILSSPTLLEEARAPRAQPADVDMKTLCR